jgi:hypothetical protein
MTRRLQIDFLVLDLTTCARCRGTGRSLESALLVVRDVLEASGIEVQGGSRCGEEPCTDGTVAPVAMIVDAILRVIYGGPPVGDGVEAEREIASCCSPAEQRTCCEPEDKAECCVASAGEGCGCR